MLFKNSNKLLKYNGKLLQTDPYNPLNLPPYTLRLKYKGINAPTFNFGSGVRISYSPNIWDLTYENSDWQTLLASQMYLIEVLGCNTYGVTNMSNMFAGCYDLSSVSLFNTNNVTNMNGMFGLCDSLYSVPLFNTNNVTNMGAMFMGCDSLSSVPLFNTYNVTNMDNMFAGCYNVQSGALALYQQASTQTNPPTNHDGTFRDCGKNTQTGSAELAQIPRDWK